VKVALVEEGGVGERVLLGVVGALGRGGILTPA
jgi:hypothetical protein